MLGFNPTSVGTPLVVSTGGSTAALPTGATVVATNVGGTQGAYCALGSSSSTVQQYIAPNGGWFALSVGAATQISCVTAAGTAIWTGLAPVFVVPAGDALCALISAAAPMNGSVSYTQF